ncbi:long-chain-fatty-acid--CoA ligase [Vulcanimicrobium alpinum]|uniref:Long-chain-fatty-acid--CoA ligase n=1 Tax=Vulcanimicrobium alpinum TaxID=3016050 RepID=A0AAN1XRS8_UNVUL|nr:AMP-binding protein [Vulcanimicrobium alpinum]BDE04790.1 long-chain-fatty-acid--CoA ligase [Vulcanimicrobium alpinum]
MVRSILDALDRHAAERPGARALDDFTYADLRAASLQVAARLRAAGVAAGDRVAIYAENRPGFALAYLGGLRAGAIVVPVNVLYRTSDLEHVLDDAAAAAVCVSEASAPFAARAGRTLIDLHEIERIARDANAPELADPPEPAADAVAILIYTSGTTGRSKGAMLTHGNLAAIGEQVVEAWRWTAADTLLLTLPLFHVHGLGAGLNGTLVAGGRAILRERFDAPTVLAILAGGEVSMFFGVPTMYVRLLASAAPAARFDAMRLFVSGSAALPAPVFEEFERRFGIAILERYGSTEFGFALSNRYDGPRYAGTVGFPLPHVDVRLADPQGNDVAAGEAGEILVHGPNVCAGYWNNPEASAAAFVRDAQDRRWYKSGDLATYDPQRGYTINGRLKELVISGGFNVYPIEVETELLRLPGVLAAAVVGAPDPARGEIPVAFLEVDGAFDADASLATLRERLASFKVPKALYPVEALPRNAMGKVEKPKLRTLLER